MVQENLKETIFDPDGKEIGWNEKDGWTEIAAKTKKNGWFVYRKGSFFVECLVMDGKPVAKRELDVKVVWGKEPTTPNEFFSREEIERYLKLRSFE